MEFNCEGMLCHCKAACCGIVPLSKKIYLLNKDKVQKEVVDIKRLNGKILPITKDLSCPFLTNEYKCAIYKDRPEFCKDFGKKDNNPFLRCPFLDKNGKIRSELEKNEASKENFQHRLKFESNKQLQKLIN